MTQLTSQRIIPSQSQRILRVTCPRLDAARRLSALLFRVCAVPACSMAVREALRMAVDDAVTFSAPFVHQAPPPPRQPRPAGRGRRCEGNL